MNYKSKSLLYFASLVLALITYYHVESIENNQNHEMAENIEIELSTVKNIN